MTDNILRSSSSCMFFADINECTEGTDRCAQNCHNTIGTYTCSCNAGYTLNADGRGCTDINECALGTDQCSQNCHNTIGSYTCSCNTGYRLNADGRRCDGIYNYKVIILLHLYLACLQISMSVRSKHTSALKIATTPSAPTPAAAELGSPLTLMGVAVPVRMDTVTQ